MYNFEEQQVGSNSNLPADFLHLHSTHEGKSVKNVVQAYLSGILTNNGESVAILSVNTTEFKNQVLNEVCDQLGIKRLSANQFHPQDNAKVENVHNFLKRALTNS